MKKLITMLALGAMVAISYADLTTFKWATGEKNSVTAGQYIHTLIDADTTPDISAYISGGQINISDLSLLSPFDSQVVGLVPVGPNAGKWGTLDIVGDGSIAGQYAYAVAADATTWGGIQVGDSLKIFSMSTVVNELWATQPAGTPALPQTFSNPTLTQNITVVPEPATVGLFGLGALSAWIIRRNKAKATEEA